MTNTQGIWLNLPKCIPFTKLAKASCRQTDKRVDRKSNRNHVNTEAVRGEAASAFLREELAIGRYVFVFYKKDDELTAVVWFN